MATTHNTPKASPARARAASFIDYNDIENHIPKSAACLHSCTEKEMAEDVKEMGSTHPLMASLAKNQPTSNFLFQWFGLKAPIVTATQIKIYLSQFINITNILCVVVILVLGLIYHDNLKIHDVTDILFTVLSKYRYTCMSTIISMLLIVGYYIGSGKKRSKKPCIPPPLRGCMVVVLVIGLSGMIGFYFDRIYSGGDVSGTSVLQAGVVDPCTNEAETRNCDLEWRKCYWTLDKDGREVEVDVAIRKGCYLAHRACYREVWMQKLGVEYKEYKGGAISPQGVDIDLH